MDLVDRLVPRPTPAEDYCAGLLEGQRYLHSLGITGWQDAIVGAYAGMADTGARPTCARPRDGDAHRARGRARCGGTASAGVRADRRPGRAARRQLAGGRFRATSVKIMQDGVARELHRRDARRRTSTGCGHATDNTRPLLRRPAEALREARRRAGRRGLPGARPRDRRPGRPRGARRVRGGPRRRRPTTTAAPPRAPPGRPPRRRRRGSPSSASPPTCSRCGPRTSRRWTS